MSEFDNNDINENQQIAFNTEQIESVRYWKERYIWLLEKYNELLENKLNHEIHTFTPENL